MANDNEYMRQYMANRRAYRRQKLLDEFGNQCQECGSSEQLEFDHRDRLTKLFVLSGQHLDGPWHRIYAEAAKCDLLCHWCHLGKSGLHNDYGGGQNKIKDPQHGTMHMYIAYTCRCQDCRYAKMLYRTKEIKYLDNVTAPNGWRRGRIPV